MRTTTHINPATTDLGDAFYQPEPDSITLEEGDLLYALVRMRKPELAVETGTGHAVATKRIGQALQDNKKGFLLSCDTEPEYVEVAAHATRFLPVDIRCTSGLKTLGCVDEYKVEFIFIDAGDVANRMKELKLIVEKDLLVPQGTLVVHDTHKEQYKPLVAYLKAQGWTYMIFDSLAGIAVFQHP